MEQSTHQCGGERRGFLKKACAIVLGSVAGLLPALAGLRVFFDPLRRGAAKSSMTFVATLQSLPEDGAPMKFRVIADRTDAWNRTPQVPIGAVYLRKTGEKTVKAFNVVCPHAGCFVDYRPEKQGYHCPCHNSTFALDGKLSDPKSPSPRGLDELDVELRNDGEVWVRFQNYLAGRQERIPVS